MNLVFKRGKSVGNLERFLSGWLGLVLAFLWGLAEGTFFFLVPDILLSLTALFKWKAALGQMIAVLAGSLLAGFLMFHWARESPEKALSLVRQVPFVPASMENQVREEYGRHGAVTLLKGPFSGIPYKVYAVLAPGRVEQLPFLLLSVPARLERLAGSVLVFALLGWFLKRKARGRLPAWVLAGWLVYWLLLYAWYWSGTAYPG